MARVEKSAFNEQVKKNLYKELLNNFTHTLEKLINDKETEAFYNGGKLNQKMIAKDLEITEQSLINYQTDRIPKYALLPIIRQYFDVPYSTLFGEIENKDIKNALIGLNIGLDDNSIKILKDLQANAMQDNKGNNYLNKFKIFLINAIIHDKSLIEDLAYTFSYYLGQIEIKNKLSSKDEKFVIRNPKDDYYLINLYRFISSIEKRFDKLANSDMITPKIKSMAYLIAEKYSGELEPLLKNNNN